MRLIFMGTPEMAVPTLDRIVTDGHEVVSVITQPDKPAGRGKHLHTPPIKLKAQELNLLCFQPARIKTEEFREFFAHFNADAAVVVAYGRILPAWLLSIPRLGCINNHFSLLPKYRGAAPVNWAIAHGETVTGVTTMQIDEGLDTGAILLQQTTPIGATETSIELSARLATIAAELMSETLMQLAAGQLTPQPQDESRATYAPMLNREDGLIDWHWSAREIVNRARGFQPFPTAWTWLRGGRLIIWVAEVETDAVPTHEPGVIEEVGKEALVVSCGNGRLLIREVQLEGKKRLNIRDFLNGVRLQPGDRLG